MPSLLLLLLLLLLFFSLFASAHSQPTLPKVSGYFIDCGADVDTVIDGRRYVPDADFILVGTPKPVPVPVVLSTLSTARSFPLDRHRKFCYSVPVYRPGKYLVRTTYFYGALNGPDSSPPVFDQIVDGTFWSVVNTTEDYDKGRGSYYESVFPAKGRTMSICIAKNEFTDSDMFINILELVLLGDSVYNTTDFDKYGLALVARHGFGFPGPTVRFPEDPYDRLWEPFSGSNLASTVSPKKSVSVLGIWNLPPAKIFDAALSSSQLEPMELQWPAVPLPNSSYYIALYFVDHQDSSSNESRLLDISINGVAYYRNLKVTQSGVVVLATEWPLSGPTKLVLAPASGSKLVPLVNAGEVFNILELGGRTKTRDVSALEGLKKNMQNVPLDWNGDPCFPKRYSWTGITCTDGPDGRILSLNMTSIGLSGSLSRSVAKLTALTDIMLGGNKLTGPIPDLSSLKRLERLHLQDNEFSGQIPASLGNIESLRELFLENNNLTGQVPSSLTSKPGLNLRTTPGNNIS